MSNVMPPCRPVTVVTFRGDCSRTFAAVFQRTLADEKRGLPGPSPRDCLLYAGHTGASTDRGTTIYGFNPDGGALPLWQVLDKLKNGEAFPGIVTDDTDVFTAARMRGLAVLSFDVLLPEPQFQVFERRLDDERRTSQHCYGFPNGDGDCNCTTWLERLGLPLLTGRMDEFIGLPGISSYPSRRFGHCT
jgi:hypothetical protein